MLSCLGRVSEIKISFRVAMGFPTTYPYLIGIREGCHLVPTHQSIVREYVVPVYQPSEFTSNPSLAQRRQNRLSSSEPISSRTNFPANPLERIIALWFGST